MVDLISMGPRRRVCGPRHFMPISTPCLLILNSIVLYIHALPYGLEVRRDFERTAMSGDKVLQDEEDAKATMPGAFEDNAL